MAWSTIKAQGQLYLYLYEGKVKNKDKFSLLKSDVGSSEINGGCKHREHSRVLTRLEVMIL